MASGLSIGLSLLLGVAVGRYALLILLPVALLLAQSGRHDRVPLAILIGVSVILGTLRGSGDAPVVAGTPGVDGSTRAVGVVVTVPVAGGAFERAILELQRVSGADGQWRDVAGRVIVYLPESGEGVSFRDEIFVVWDVTGVDALAPGYANYVRAQDAVASAWVFTYTVQEAGPAFFDTVSDVRRDVSRVLQQSFGGDAGALASGIVTGDDSAMSDATEDAFRRTGTAHVTAVSGQNVSLLLGFLSLWLRPTGRWKRFISHGTMIVAVWLFALMVGLEPPALRASTVATLTILGSYSGRRPDPLTLLALSLGAMALIAPGVTRTVGFWLSASASFALCSVVLTDPPEGVRGKLLNLGMGPLAASIGTLPVLLWTFGEWSPVSPVANAVLSPIMTLLFPVAYVYALVAMIAPPVASLVAWTPGIGLDLSLSIIERMSAIAPQIHLDAVGETGAIMIAFPAFVLLLAWSRDGARWLRVLSSRW
jgi:ComEC/Rec2-related protein